MELVEACHPQGPPGIRHLVQEKDKFSDDFDREHHIGKYRVKHKVNFDKKLVKEPEQDQEEYEDTDPEKRH